MDQAAASSAGRAASLTYEPYYGLKEKPFSLSADPRFFYKSRSHTSAFNDLLAAIRRREGLIVLTGDIGTGKTTLCSTVLEHLDGKTFTSFVPDPTVSRTDLLKILLVDFGVVSVNDLKKGRLKGASRPDLSYPLYEFLVSLVPLQALAVLIIDEAQNLTPPVLDELRILLDLEGREKLLQVILVGQPDLGSQLKLPLMRQLHQRVSMRCELEPLSREAVTGYVTHRLNIAGGGDERITFSPGACDIVYAGSGGVPRLINRICDRALHYAWAQRTASIEPDVISMAVRDLGLTGALPSAAPQSGKVRRSPHGLFEKAVPTDEPRLQSTADLWALLTISPATRPTGPSLAEVGGAELGSADVFVAAQPAEAGGERRPERPEGSAARQQARHHQESPPRRVSPLAVALAVTVLVGAVGLGLAYQRGMSLFVGDLPPIADVPSRALSFRSPVFPTQLPSEDVTLQGKQPAALAAPQGPSAPGMDAAQSYVIQVASFEGELRASRLVKELNDAGYRAYQIDVDCGDRGLLRSVLVGRYSTLGEAKPDLAQIRQMPAYDDARILAVQPSHLSPGAR